MNSFFTQQHQSIYNFFLRVGLLLLLFTVDIKSQHVIAAGEKHSLYVCSNGTIVGSGTNASGQLGDYSVTETHTNTLVVTMTSVTGIAAGRAHSMALVSNGTIWAWGDNTYGQMGNYTFATPQYGATGIMNISGSIAIAAGNNSCYSLNNDGSVWAWGSNSSGQLGDGTLITKNYAVKVQNLNSVVAIAGGIDFAMALKSDGTVWTWGSNAFGQCGDNTLTDRYTPVKVIGLSGIKSIASNGRSGYALKSDGTVWAWGDNSSGQLGDNTTQQRLTPVQVVGLSDVRLISGGSNYGLAIKKDGTGWGWGDNSYGQLGDGTQVARYTAVPVGLNISGLQDITGSIEGYHTIALLSNTTVKTWGHNANGQLGNNSVAAAVTSPVIPINLCVIGYALNISFAAQSNINCTGEKTGSASVYVSGGNPPYTYDWLPYGGNSSTATGLGAGTYTCIVSDNNSISGTYTFTITEPPAVTVSSTVQSVPCYGQSTGSIALNVSGGSPPYTYTWSPAVSNSSTAANLSAGLYTCTITDKNNCLRSETFTIQQASALSLQLAHTNALCHGNLTGTASVTVNGGTANYTYTWSPGGNTSASISGLGAGSYTCTVTDANQCTKSTVATISEPPALTASTQQQQVLCYGGNNGSATVTVSGGTLPYTYLWSPGGSTTPSINNLSAGNFVCTITDKNNCILTQHFSITQPNKISGVISGEKILCYGDSTGSAAINISGGTSPYTFHWLPYGGTAAQANHLAAGTYSCLVTDANNCDYMSTINITEPSRLTATSTQQHALCKGSNTGNISITAAGGTLPYTYLWSPSGALGASVTNLSAGTYTCTIKDSANCTLVKIMHITKPDALQLQLSTVHVDCFGQNTGSVTTTVSGGTPGYTYAWLPGGGSAASLSNLGAGSYTCMVTDNNNCKTEEQVSITQSNGLNIQFNQPAVCLGDSSKVMAQVSGGNAPYQYNWSPAAVNASSISALQNNTLTYTLTVTDAKNCTKQQSILSVVYPLPQVLVSSNAPNNVFLYEDETSLLCLQDLTPQASQWNWVFDNNQVSNSSSPCFKVDEDREYCAQLVVSDVNGCKNQYKTCIKVEIPEIVVPTVFTPNNDGSNNNFFIKCTGYSDLSCTIYNRWGSKVYNWSGLSGSWDGHIQNGDEACDGTYFCTLELTNLQGTKKKKTTYILLVR